MAGINFKLCCISAGRGMRQRGPDLTPAKSAARTAKQERLATRCAKICGGARNKAGTAAGTHAAQGAGPGARTAGLSGAPLQYNQPHGGKAPAGTPRVEPKRWTRSESKAVCRSRA